MLSVWISDNYREQTSISILSHPQLLDPKGYDKTPEIGSTWSSRDGYQKRNKSELASPTGLVLFWDHVTAAWGQPHMHKLLLFFESWLNDNAMKESRRVADGSRFQPTSAARPPQNVIRNRGKRDDQGTVQVNISKDFWGFAPLGSISFFLFWLEGPEENLNCKCHLLSKFWLHSKKKRKESKGKKRHLAPSLIFDQLPPGNLSGRGKAGSGLPLDTQW